LHLNWNKAQQHVHDIVNLNGTLVQWLSGSTDRTNSYNVLDTNTYGYGDAIRSWVTGSIRALVTHVSATDVVLDAGFYIEDYERIYVDNDANIEYWDQIIYPSGSCIRYVILPLHIWRLGDVIVGKYANIRKLVPRSGSSY